MARQNESEKKGKVRVVGYVSPYLKEIIKEAIESGDYASESDFVSEAVVRLAHEWKMRKERKITSLE